MGLIKSLKLKFKPSYEVKSERFYSKFLNEEDAQNLRPFVVNFGNRLIIPSAILAVGSSVFPSQYFDSRKKINQKDPTAEVDESYGDIDLLIVPESVSKLTDLEKSVQDALTSLGFQGKLHEITSSGVSYHKQNDRTYCPFLHLDYGLHSIETNLKNGTKLDLILGRDDLLEQTASQKIAKDRNGKYAFSLLYRR
ncbi:hypothetical protein KAJ87_00690 [Candidatus Pacearchaeota archaeon]|nr:hypothetical protein [Candidatus Pacearchaeota archaeon]